MGIYLNPGSDQFQDAVNSEIYVDKTGLISYTNRVFMTTKKYLCVSRPRRFGKSIAANMIAAYYDRTVNAIELFAPFRIAKDSTFRQHAGKYDVLQINMQDFLSRTDSIQELLSLLKRSLLWELLKEYPEGEFSYFDKTDLMGTMSEVFQKTKRRFVIVIDEWDCIFREYKDRNEDQRQYLDFLRMWLKDKAYVGLAYMTGILPIKKYGTHSALNMFWEFSMENPDVLAEYVGFTESEVRTLCREYQMDFEECKAWYDGYRFPNEPSIYNPRSVVGAMSGKLFDTYWNRTETYEALKLYIDMDFDGMREAILTLLAGEPKKMDTGTFANDMTTLHRADDVLALLIHLGYLGYDFPAKEVFIPNREIAMEYVNALQGNSGWEIILEAIKESDDLLNATWNGREEKVAIAIERAHAATSHLQYNDENALSYAVSLAYYSAKRFYNIVREFPSGKGYADIVFLPRPQHSEKPAILIELKWDRNAETAIRQIKEKSYMDALEGYSGKILLVGINYKKSCRKHECRIEAIDV